MFHLLDIARPLSFPLEADNEMVMQLLAALILTILIEYGVLWMLLERRKKVLLSSIAVNVLTNVPLNLYVMLVNDSMGDILIGEAVVFLVEALWYWFFTRNLKLAAIYSFLCNAISFLIGLLLSYAVKNLSNLATRRTPAYHSALTPERSDNSFNSLTPKEVEHLRTFSSTKSNLNI